MSRKDKLILAQSIAEVCLLLFIIVIALAGIQLYVKRALQARYKGSADAAVTMALLATNHETYMQYEPYYKDESQASMTKHSSVESMEQQGDSRQLRTRTHYRQDSQASSRIEADIGRNDIWSWEAN